MAERVKQTLLGILASGGAAGGQCRPPPEWTACVASPGHPSQPRAPASGPRLGLARPRCGQRCLSPVRPPLGPPLPAELGRCPGLRPRPTPPSLFPRRVSPLADCGVCPHPARWPRRPSLCPALGTAPGAGRHSMSARGANERTNGRMDGWTKAPSAEVAWSRLRTPAFSRYGSRTPWNWTSGNRPRPPRTPPTGAGKSRRLCGRLADSPRPSPAALSPLACHGSKKRDALAGETPFSKRPCSR